MNCDRFERWLDEGRPAGEAEAARAHAAGCPRCAAALEAAEEIEFELMRFARPAPAEFTARVMARVSDAEAAGLATQPLVAPLDWWVRTAAEPATALALVLAGLLLGWGDALRGLAAPAMLRLASMLAQVPRVELPRPALLANPDVPLALALAAAPFLLWGSWRLYLAAEHACGTALRGRS